jgi:hypothetical protein
MILSGTNPVTGEKLSLLVDIGGVHALEVYNQRGTKLFGSITTDLKKIKSTLKYLGVHPKRVDKL